MEDRLRDYLHGEIVWPGALRMPGEEYEVPFSDALAAEAADRPVSEDAPRDVSSPGWPDRYKAWTMQEMRRNGWSVEGLARVFKLTPSGVEMYLRKETRA